MSYIEHLINGDIKPTSEQISLEEYLLESVYITKYMSPRIKATNIATYHAMFYLSYGINGVGEFSLPWPTIGSLCGNERGGTLTKNEAVRERTKVLTELGCIKISKNRVGANDFTVIRPSEIPFVAKLISLENSNQHQSAARPQKIDCYNDKSRRLKLLERENYKCAYCLIHLTIESYYLDHIKPRASGGSNFKSNLVSSCEKCNSNKSDDDVFDFLKSNYRKGLLSQSEFLKQQEYLKTIIDSDSGEP